MSTLRNAEGSISGFIDRVFGRVFRGYVEPVELARKLAREMEDHKTVSVSHVYVPNEFVIYLSPRDHERFASFQTSLCKELSSYLTERARHEGFTLLSEPAIRIETDQALTVGAYGIACRVVDAPPQEAPAVAPESDDGTASESSDGPHTTARPTPTVDDPFSPFVPATEPEPEASDDDEGGAPEVSDDAGDAEHDLHDEDRGVDEGVPSEVSPDPADQREFHAAGDDVESDEVDSGPPPEPPATPDGDDAVAAPEPSPDPVDWPVAAPAQDEPLAPAALNVEPPAPEVSAPVPPPIAPAAGHGALAGVSGTQMFQPPEQEEVFVQEEMSLILDGRRFRVTRRTTTLGRSRDCDVPVSDPNASRRHAEIRHIGLDYFLVDQNSTNGTYVNGQRIRRHALANGDRITIGTSELIVEHITVERR